MPDRPKRINVAVTDATVEAIQHVIDSEGVSLTEAVRRLVGYGDFSYRQVKDEDGTLVVHRKDGSTRTVVLL